MTPGQLIRLAQRTATEADRLGRAFAIQLAKVLRDTERRLPPLLTDVTRGDRTAIVYAGQANATRTQLRRVLTDAGYDDLAGVATNAPLDKIAARVLASRRFAQQSADLQMPVVGRLEALKHLHLSDLLDVGDDIAKALNQATMRGVFNSRTPAAILRDLGDVLDSSDADIRTLYDTSVSIYGRQVEAIAAGDDPTATFAYMGPIDNVTRDWCLARVGKVFTHAEIDAMDNGQLDNVFLTGGGYNCRHVWMEVAKTSELQDLGDGRIPEVQDQLDALDEAA